MKSLRKGLKIAILTMAAVTFIAGFTATNVEAAASPKLNKTTATVTVGKTNTLKATLNGKNVTKVTWSTSNKTVATVSSKGVVKGKKAGNATIKAKVNGKTVACKVTVKNAVTVTAAPKLNKTSISLKVSNTFTLKATVNGKTASKVTWSTSNKSIATVTTNGIVTGKKAGSTTIKAKVNGKAVACKVTVTKTTSATETTAKANMTTYKQFMNDVVKYTNQYRAKNGRKAVTMDNTLAFVASYRSAEMAQKDILSHTRPNGSKFYDLAKKYGVSYTFIGENIGAYQMSAKEVVDAWYNSAGHRANMLSTNYTKIGVGIGLTSDGYYYWTQIFKG